MSFPLDIKGYPGTQGSEPGAIFDGGDTAAILGTLISCGKNEWISKLPAMFNNGIPLRHWDRTQWWGQPDRFSRDQLIPMACAYVKNPDNVILEQYYRAHKMKDFLLAWNVRGNGSMNMPKKFPDFTFIDVMGLWLRARKPKGFKLLLPFCDLPTLVDALLWKYYQPTSNRITRNFILISMTQRDYYPSFISRLAYKLTNWSDLITRWIGNCEDIGEYQTGHLLMDLYNKI